MAGGNEDINGEVTTEMGLNMLQYKLRSPETVMCTSDPQLDLLNYKELSGEVIRKKLPSKFNPDVPDYEKEDTQTLESKSNSKLNASLEAAVPDQNDSRSINIQVELSDSIETKFDDHLLDKTISIDRLMQIDRTRCMKNLTGTDNSFKHITSHNGNSASTKKSLFDESNAKRPECTKERDKSDVRSFQNIVLSSCESQPNNSTNKCCSLKRVSNSTFNGRSSVDIGRWDANKEKLLNLEHLGISERQRNSEKLYSLEKCRQTNTYINSCDDICHKRHSFYYYRDHCCHSMIEEKQIDYSPNNSPPAKKSRTTLHFDKSNVIARSARPRPLFYFSNQGDTHPLIDNDTNNYKTALKTRLESSTLSRGSLELPTVSDSDCRTLGSEAHIMHTDRSENSRRSATRSQFPSSIIRVAEFCTWISKKFLEFVRKSTLWIRKMLLRNASTSTIHSEPLGNELAQLITTLHCENKHTVSMLSEKVINLSQDLIQVQAKSVAAVQALTTEMSSMREVNNHLAESNTMLREQLKSLHDVLGNMQPTLLLQTPHQPSSSPVPPRSVPPLAPPQSLPSLAPSQSLPSPAPFQFLSSSALPQTQSSRTPPQSLPIPPPPPPPPPLPPQPIFSSSEPTTPRCNFRTTARSPDRKCSTPLQQGRPPITVEDLLKVTLKKAPSIIRDNRRNTIGGARGPAVSLDMLRNVKLRSARRRTSDHILKSPRSSSGSLRNRLPPSLNLSPIMRGTDHSFSRVLRQVDTNRRGSKRILSSPTRSDVGLFKENLRPFSLVKQSKSHTMTA